MLRGASNSLFQPKSSSLRDATLPHNLQIPAPPPRPKKAVIKGFKSQDYWHLIYSLSEEERTQVLGELESREIIATAEVLEKQLKENELVINNLDNARKRFLAGLLLLREKKISKGQLASMHILDSAIRTLYTNPMMFLTHEFVDNGILSYAINHQACTPNSRPTNVKRYRYNFVVVPTTQTQVNELPERMRYPLVRRFFNFTNDEWVEFDRIMQNFPESEKFIHVLQAPHFGCWSSIISKLQELMQCMHVMDWVTQTKSGQVTENIMVVPSFSMFQAAINAKAKVLNCKPLELVPTYYYMEEDRYIFYKSMDLIPLTLYLPEQSHDLRYNSDEGRYRTTIDGRPCETAFAGALHDVYHAFREMQMKPGIRAARVRLASIAKFHAANRHIDSEVSTKLMDGELIFSYPKSEDTLFNSVSRPKAQSFGSLFYKVKASDILRGTFILDMVEHKDEWLLNFQLGRNDLLPQDQALYDVIEELLNVIHANKVQQFLMHINNCNLEGVRIMIEKDPGLILEEGSIGEHKLASALRLARDMGDVGMCKLLLEHLRAYDLQCSKPGDCNVGHTSAQIAKVTGSSRKKAPFNVKNFDRVADAISNHQSDVAAELIRHRNPDHEMTELSYAMDAFRRAIDSHGQLTADDMINVFDALVRNADKFKTYEQLNLFFLQVMGYVARNVPTCLRMALNQNIWEMMYYNKVVDLSRETTCIVNNVPYSLVDFTPNSGLGFDFALDIFGGGGMNWAVSRGMSVNSGRWLQKFCMATKLALVELKLMQAGFESESHHKEVMQSRCAMM